MGSDDYWVGLREDTGGLWLYDPSLQHDDPNTIYAFHVYKGEMREYSKDVITTLSTVKDSRREAVIEKYLKWYEKHGTGFVASDRRRKQEKEEKDRKEWEARAEKHRKEAIERHKAYLEKHGKQYSGVTTSSNKKHRVTHCYLCKSHLDSLLHIECNSCNWLICYCGACGCGYES